MAKEIECKLLAPDSGVLQTIRQDFAGLGAEQTADYETVYYDLGAYADRAWMFRARRDGDGATIYTCKTPGEGYARNEWECEAASAHEAAKRLSAMGAPAELAAISEFPVHCGAAFRRTAIVLARGQTVIELAIDEGSLSAPGKAEAVCEVELELKSGPAEPMLALRDELIARYGLSEGSLSKYARARLLAQGKEDTNEVQ